MKKIKSKNIILFIAVLLISVLISVPAYAGAGDDTDFSAPNEKDIYIEVSVPEGFSEEITVYFNDIPRELIADTEYKMNTVLQEGSYSVKALVSSDLNGDIKFDGPSTFSTDDKTLKLTLYDTSEDYVKNNDDDIEFETVEIYPATIDYSNGDASGTLFISSESYGAVQSAIYTLQNTATNEYYEITLSSDNVFEAEVTLPAGKYIESPAMDVTLDKHAKAPAGLHIIWSHTNDSFTFGEVYEVKAGEKTNTPILYLVTTVDGQTFEEFDSSAFFQATLEKNLIEAQENHKSEVLNGESEVETVSETISYTGFNESKEEESKSVNIFFIIALILAIGIVVFFIIKRHKHMKEEEESSQYNDDDEDF